MFGFSRVLDSHRHRLAWIDWNRQFFLMQRYSCDRLRAEATLQSPGVRSHSSSASKS